MAVKTITVSTAAQLTEALSKATGGETILLASGNYGGLTLNSKTKFNFDYESKVTIRSADPDHPAVFTGLDITRAGNLSFENLTFDYTWKTGQSLQYAPFSVSNSSNISISNSTFDGHIATTGDKAGIGFATGTGLQLSRNTNFDFIGNEVYNFWKGMGIGACDNTRIIGNDFHSLRSDGMTVVVPQGMLIEGNHFHDFQRAPDSGDHADMIQFWTTNSTRPGTDITIRNNLLDIGEGGPTHSIFMRNDMVDKGLAGTEMYYKNVLIEQNTIYNDHLHGISVGETAGLTIRNNTVLHANGGAEGNTGKAETPLIGVAQKSTDVTIVNNIAGKVAGGLEGYNGLPESWTVANNLLAQDDDRTAADHYSTLFVSTSYDNGASGGADGRAYLALPGGAIETMGVGADRTLIDRTPDAAKAVFHVGVLPSDDAVYVFDAANLSYGPKGLLADAGARFLWTFGDGTTAEGGVVTHSYAKAGNYAVKLEVVQPDGSRMIATDTVQRLGLDLLRFDAKTGKFALSDGFTDTMLALPTGVLAGRTGQRTLDLDVPTKAGIAAKDIEALFGADNFTLSMQLKADVTADSSGSVFRMQNALNGVVTREGNFAFTLSTDDGQKTTVTTSGVSLLDGRVHDVNILFNADKGLLSISIDGKAAVSAPVTGHMPPMGPWGLTFGNPPVGEGFDGKLLKFDLDVDRSNYPVYQAELPSTKAPAEFIPPQGPDLALFDDYVLDGAAMAQLTATQFKFDAHLVQEGGKTVIALDGTDDRVQLGKLAQFADADRLAIAIDFQRDQADGSRGVLVANSGQIRLDLIDDGFRLRVATADEGMKTYNIRKLGLNNTDHHEAKVIVDAVADRLQVYLDDKLVLEDRHTDLVMTNPAGGSGGGWVVGNGFDGTISGLRIDDDIGHQLSKGDVVLFA